MAINDALLSVADLQLNGRHAAPVSPRQKRERNIEVKRILSATNGNCLRIKAPLTAEQKDADTQRSELAARMGINVVLRQLVALNRRRFPPSSLQT